MEKSKLAFAIDEFLRAAAIWLLSAICIRYAVKEIYLIILIATAVTMLLTLLIRHYYGKKNLTAQKIKKTDEAMDELMVADRQKFIYSLCCSLNGSTTSDCVICDNTVIYPYFYGKLPLEKLNFAYNFALNQGKKLLVLCAEASLDVQKNLHLFSATPVTVLTKKQTYEFLEKHDSLPRPQNRPKKKVSLSKMALSKSKIKGYLCAALVLLVTASFSPYALLCIIAAAVNITLSILCEIKG